MLLEILTLAVIIVFTLLAFRKNAVMFLSISFVLVYLIELYAYSTGNILSYFMEFACKSGVFDVGTFTAIYVHSLNPGHIFFNILIFFLVGYPFERRIGSFRFTSIFLVSGVVANIGYSSFLYFYHINSFIIGASGAIFGIMGAFLILYPNDEITMFLGPILMPRVKVKYAVLAFMAVEFIATLFWVNDNVAHGAHVIGAVTGAVFAYAIRNRISLRTVGSGTISRKVDYALFDKLADTDDLKRVCSRIREEQDEIVCNSWILEFFRKKYGDAQMDGKYVKAGGRRFKVFR